MKKKTVECGFRKWSISLTEDYNVIVDFGNYPINGSMTFWNLNSSEMKQIGLMFLGGAKKLDAWYNRSKKTSKKVKAK